MSCCPSSSSSSGDSGGPCIWFPAGTTAVFLVKAYNCTDADPINLTGSTILFTLRNNPFGARCCDNSAGIVLVKTIGAGLVAVDLSIGQFQIVFAPSDTELLAQFATYYWQVKLTLADGTVLIPTQLNGTISFGQTPPTFCQSGGAVIRSGAPCASVEGVDPETPPPAAYGDVFGPASSVNNRIAVFDGTTGKLIKDGGYSIQNIYESITQEVADREAADAVLAQSITDSVNDLSAAISSGDAALQNSIDLLFKRDEFTNSSGNQTITPAFGVKIYEVVLTIANGSAREIFVYLGNTGSMEAALIWVKVKLPAVSGFVIKFAAASAPLVVLDQTTSDASGRAFSVTFRGKLSDNSWEKIAAAYPIS